jgi:ribonuclease D
MKACRIAVTPKSGRIVSITAESEPFETLGEAQREAMLLVSLLKEKYLPKVEEPSLPPPIAQPPAAAKATSQIKAVIATPHPTKSATPAPASAVQPKPLTSFKARRSSRETEPFPPNSFP